MKNIVLLFIISISLVACSTPKETASLDENLVFEDLDSVDFDDDSEEFADFENEPDEDKEFADFENEPEGDEDEEFTDLEDDSDLEGEFADLEDDSDLEGEFANLEGDSDVEEDFADFEDDEEFGEETVVEAMDFDSFEDDPKEETVATEELDFEVAFDSPLEVKEPMQKEPVIEEVSFDMNASNEKNQSVKSIDYNAFQGGGSFIVSTTGEIDYSTELVPETNQYIVKLKNTVIGKKLARPFLTKDFKQSFEAMNSYSGDDGSVNLVFQLKDKSSPQVSVIDGKLLIEPGLMALSDLKANNLSGSKDEEISLSATSFEDFLLGKSKFVGEPVSLQVKDESVVTIIQFIAEQVGANIVLSSGVTGNISIKLKNVPWDQALVNIMKSKGLGYVRNGNILRVAPLAELQAESVAAAAVQQARKTLSPFHVKVFPLSYANPATIETKIKPFLTQGTAANGRAGQVLSEVRSSSLIVRDTLEVIENVSALIKEMDSPPLQVMIQAKIVEAAKNFSKEISGALNNSFSSTIPGGNLFTGGSIFSGVEDGATAPSFIPAVDVGGLNFFGTLSARLRLQEINSKAKVLSSPSVMVINNEKANILQSDQVLNQVQTILDGVPTITLERSPVELRLDVTPQVSADSNISMEIEVKRDFPQLEALGSAISSRSAKTKVLIGNNKTAMIGGIYQVVENESESGAPGLRKIPLLGWLFKGTSRSKRDTELVIFVTPRVVRPTSVGDKWADQKLKPPKGGRVSKL